MKGSAHRMVHPVYFSRSGFHRRNKNWREVKSVLPLNNSTVWIFFKNPKVEQETSSFQLKVDIWFYSLLYMHEKLVKLELPSRVIKSDDLNTQRVVNYIALLFSALAESFSPRSFSTVWQLVDLQIWSRIRLKYLNVSESKEFGRPENLDSNVSPIYRPFCAVRFFERSSFSLKTLPLEASARKEVK